MNCMRARENSKRTQRRRTYEQYKEKTKRYSDHGSAHWSGKIHAPHYAGGHSSRNRWLSVCDFPDHYSVEGRYEGGRRRSTFRQAVFRADSACSDAGHFSLCGAVLQSFYCVQIAGSDPPQSFCGPEAALSGKAGRA